MVKRSILILTFLMVTLCCGNQKESVTPDDTKTPIFFVHGHGMSAGSFNTLIAYLQQESNYPASYLRTIQLVPDDGSNIEAAENQIAPAVEDFLEEINEFIQEEGLGIPLKTKVNIISHSMGGLSSRWYVAKVRPDRVHKWISLAGANHGTDVLCRWSGEGADDMCPANAENEEQSLIQYQLNGDPPGSENEADVDETPYGLGTDLEGVNVIEPTEGQKVLYVTIRTSNDSWIDPDESVILDGAGGVEIPIPGDLPATITSDGNILMQNDVGHDEMLEDKDVMRLIKIILELRLDG